MNPITNTKIKINALPIYFFPKDEIDAPSNDVDARSIDTFVPSIDVDAFCYDIDARSIDAFARSNDVDAFCYDIDARSIDTFTRSNDVDAFYNDIVTRSVDAFAPSIDIDAPNFYPKIGDAFFRICFFFRVHHSFKVNQLLAGLLFQKCSLTFIVSISVLIVFPSK
ncbi:MAG TPA: hypothetical protein VIH57_11965 [Bacteroidales bacterium]